MNGAASHGSLLLAGAVVGYLMVMTTNPARSSLRDGLRCLKRYPQMWLVPLLFATTHAGFNLWVRFYEAWVIPDAPPALVPWTGWQPPILMDVLGGSGLPAAESTSSLFNCVVTAFPLSALWAALFLGNWQGNQAVVYRGLLRRCGRAGSLLIHAFFLLCAFAALCKPILFGGLPKLNSYLGVETLLRTGEVMNALSFFFEYLLGVGVQIYLLLLAFAWVRGLTFGFDKLRLFALRRFAFVFKWAAVVLAISAVGINLPLIVGSFQDPAAGWEPAGIIRATRWALAGLLTVFCAMQVLLIFHNESLRRALGDTMHLWRRHGWPVAWLIVVAALHFSGLSTANAFLPSALGQWSWPAAVWTTLIYPLLWSLLAGWFLASWVCLFQRCEHNRFEEGDLVRF